MAGQTSVTCVGNITADPEVRYTQSGRAVANLTVASTARKFDKASGQFVQDGETLFMRVTLWGEYAEHVAKSLRKGARVVVVGDLVQRSYETKEGEKRTSMELVAQEVAPSLMFVTAELSQSTPRAAATGQDGFTPDLDDPSFAGYVEVPAA